MRRSLVGSVGAMVVLLASLAGSAGATAAVGAPKTQDRPQSTWVQPGTAPLDGLGTFVYLDAPTAGATQGSALGYEYEVTCVSRTAQVA